MMLQVAAGIRGPYRRAMPVSQGVGQHGFPLRSPVRMTTALRRGCRVVPLWAGEAGRHTPRQEGGWHTG